MSLNINSLEVELKAGFLFTLCVELGLVLWLLSDWDWRSRIIFGVSLLIVNGFIFKRIYQKVRASFDRVNLQLDAINVEDYSLFSRTPYAGGVVDSVHQNLNVLSERLQEQKSQFDQHMFVIYRLIEQLNTPILVFNHLSQLSSANSAFKDLYDKPWQAMQYTSPERLQLSEHPTWHFLDAKKQNEWQIRHSNFVDKGKRYQLLVFINIQTALRETQLNAWKNLIRVMSHEIKNTLTPVSALTQSLRAKESEQRNQQALDVIIERCNHLQDFVSRYAQLQNTVACQFQDIDSGNLSDQLTVLFPDVLFNFNDRLGSFRADPILIEQVMINLVKNAVEASYIKGSEDKCVIDIVLSKRADVSEIKIIDRGQGIQNIDNVFVPLYSTKPGGQGIGLALSRHLVEKMGGQLTLTNNVSGKGACATLLLPVDD